MNWDYIVIGAGSAGCALTFQLVQAGHSVLLLESGSWDRSPFIKIAATQPQAMARFDWGYKSQPDPTRNGVVESWIRGHVVGGSSSINGTMYTRGVAWDFDRWKVPGWSWKDVLPVFREIERSDQNGPLRGTQGQLHVRTVKHPHPITKAFVESARTYGLPFTPDYNGVSQEGVGYAQLTQRGRFRCSAADAFLRPVLHKKNLTLRVRCDVERIEIEGSRATAVHFRSNGAVHRESAKEIVLCAGVINSPKLLLLSGVGAADQLKQHGIPVRVDLPGVGRNLREQPLLHMEYRTRIPTYNLTEGILQKIGIARQFLTTGEGPISNLFEGAAFLKSSTNKPQPDVQVISTAFGYIMGPDSQYQLAPYPSMMILLMASYPLSTGCIRLASSRPTDAPLIECQLLSAPPDLESLVGAVGVIRGIMDKHPIAGLIAEELTPGPRLQTYEDIKTYARHHATVSMHPIGTCGMGLNGQSVVGPDLKVHGVENLRVADASVIPDHLSANLNAVCIMIGTKLGQQLTGKKTGLIH